VALAAGGVSEIHSGKTGPWLFCTDPTNTTHNTATEQDQERE